MSAQDRAEIEALLAAWARHIDGGQATEAIHLFTDDAQQSLPSGTSVGKEAILAGLQRRQALVSRVTRHLVSNLLLHHGQGPQLRGRWILTLFRSDRPDDRPAAIQLVADVEDVYEQVQGGWRVARRTITPVFGSA